MTRLHRGSGQSHPERGIVPGLLPACLWPAAGLLPELVLFWLRVGGAILRHFLHAFSFPGEELAVHLWW